MPKIIRFHETGSADVLKIEDLPLTEPGDRRFRPRDQRSPITDCLGDHLSPAQRLEYRTQSDTVRSLDAASSTHPKTRSSEIVG